MEANKTSPQDFLRVVIARETCDYRIVTDDPDNWHVVATRQISKGERITSTGSTSYVHLGSAAGMEIMIADSDDRKYVTSIQHAVPGDASCDPTVLELPWCLLNHSCDPNSLDSWESTTSGDVALTATRTISAGEPITYDYALEQFLYRSPFQCGCGATSCRGIISGFSGLSEAERTRIMKQASSYVRDRYHRESVLDETQLKSVGRVESNDITRGKADNSPAIVSDASEPPHRAGLEADKTWFSEGTVPGRRQGNVNHGFHISELVHQAQTPFQECLIFDNPVYGRVLVLDGLVQLTTFDEHIYHEMLVHPPMFAHPQPRRVAIIGGGDGGTLREVLRHDPQEVVMIDIDEQFVRIAEQHLPSLSAGAFADKRVTLLFEDAMMALQRYENEFDVIIIDCNDAVGPSEPLFEEPFYEQVARALRPDGTCSVQGGSTLDPEFLQQVQQRMANRLGPTIGYRLTIPSYHCGDYIFFVASNSRNPAGPDSEALAKLQTTRGIATRYWSPELHHASQVLPKDSSL